MSREYELSNMSRASIQPARYTESRENLMKAKEKRMVGLRLIQTRLPDRIKPIRLDPLESRIGFLCLAHLRFRLIPPFPLNQPYLEISY